MVAPPAFTQGEAGLYIVLRLSLPVLYTQEPITSYEVDGAA